MRLSRVGFIVPMNDNNGLLGRRGRDELDNTEYWNNMFLWKLRIKPMTVQGENTWSLL